jgi:hypothetical protein
MSQTALGSLCMKENWDCNKAILELDKCPNLKCQSALSEIQVLFADGEI